MSYFVFVGDVWVYVKMMQANELLVFIQVLPLHSMLNQIHNC